MTANEKNDIIRDLATEIITLLDSKPISPLMPWMIPTTPDEFAATIAGQCAYLAVEIVKLVTDSPITINPN